MDLSWVGLTDFAKLIVFNKKSFEMDGQKSTMSKFIRKLLLLLLIFLNHVTTTCAFLHWFIFNFSLMDLCIWSMQYLVIISVSHFSGFISLDIGLFWKFSLWFFSLRKDWFWLYCSVLSLKLRSFRSSFWISVFNIYCRWGSFFVRFTNVFN